MSVPAAAPWIAAQTSQLLAQRGHAWLLAGPSGLGQYRLALALVMPGFVSNRLRLALVVAAVVATPLTCAPMPIYAC